MSISFIVFLVVMSPVLLLMLLTCIYAIFTILICMWIAPLAVFFNVGWANRFIEWYFGSSEDN